MPKAHRSTGPYDIEAWAARECSTLRPFLINHWRVNHVEEVCAKVGIKTPGHYAKTKLWERDCIITFNRGPRGRLERIIACREVAFILNGNNIIMDAYLI